MPDGSKRKRRQGDTAKAKWYAKWRTIRFNRRFGLVKNELKDLWTATAVTGVAR